MHRFLYVSRLEKFILFQSSGDPHLSVSKRLLVIEGAIYLGRVFVSRTHKRLRRTHTHAYGSFACTVPSIRSCERCLRVVRVAINTSSSAAAAARSLNPLSGVAHISPGEIHFQFT